MGTNYYATFIVARQDFFKQEYHVAETLHVGKISAGWAFTWHGFDEDDMPQYLIDAGVERIVTVDDWVKLLETKLPYKIEDEYGREMSVQEFLTYALGSTGKLVKITDTWGQKWRDTYNGVTYSFSAGDWC